MGHGHDRGREASDTLGNTVAPNGGLSISEPEMDIVCHQAQDTWDIPSIECGKNLPSDILATCHSPILLQWLDAPGPRDGRGRSWERENPTPNSPLDMKRILVPPIGSNRLSHRHNRQTRCASAGGSDRSTAWSGSSPTSARSRTKLARKRTQMHRRDGFSVPLGARRQPQVPRVERTGVGHRSRSGRGGATGRCSARKQVIRLVISPLGHLASNRSLNPCAANAH